MYVLLVLAMFGNGVLKVPPSAMMFGVGHGYSTKLSCDIAADAFNAIDFHEKDADGVPMDVHLRAFCIRGR